MGKGVDSDRIRKALDRVAPLTPHQRGHVYRKCAELDRFLEDGNGDEGLQRLTTAARWLRSYELMQLALDLWEQTDPDERERVTRRARYAISDDGVVSRLSTPDLEKLIAAWFDYPPTGTPAQVQRWHRRRDGRYRAMRAELRRRQNPNLRLAWVNDRPRAAASPPAHEYDLSDILAGVLRRGSDDGPGTPA